MHLKTISERLKAILDLLGNVLAPTWRQLGPSWERLGLAKASQASQKTLKFLRFF